jgi:hypothetical protein
MKNVLRVLLGLLMLLAMLLLASCSGGAPGCPGVTFGTASCSGGGTEGFGQGGGGGAGGGGGGGGGGSGSTALFVYFADDNNGDIDAASLTTSGSFSLISGFTEPTFAPAIDGGMVIAQKQWLYLPLSSLLVLGYGINGSTGALTAMPNGPFVSPNTFTVTADPGGNFLFVAGESSGQISVFLISQTDGSLTQATGSPFTVTGLNAVWRMATDGQGKFLYVTGGPPSASNGIAAFAIGATTSSSPGSLTPVTGSPFTAAGFNMTEIAAEPSGQFMFGVTGNVGVNGETTDDHIYAFSIQSSGALVAAANSPFATQYAPYNLAVHPQGQYVYTFNESSTGAQDPVEGFQIDTATGALTEVPSSPFTTLLEPGGQFDQAGGYMIGHPAGALDAISVNTATGDLTFITELGIGSNFGWAVTDPH